MLDAVRKYVEALTGVGETTKDKAERIVRELHERGEVRARDISRAAGDLVERSVRNRRELVRLIRKEIREQVRALGLVTQDDLDRLARRIKTLEADRKPSAKASAKKPTTSKKS